MAITLEPALYDLAELRSKIIVVEKMVNTQTGAGRFPRVSRTNTLLGGADARWDSGGTRRLAWDRLTSTRQAQLP